MPTILYLKIVCHRRSPIFEHMSVTPLTVECPGSVNECTTQDCLKLYEEGDTSLKDNEILTKSTSPILPALPKAPLQTLVCDLLKKVPNKLTPSLSINDESKFVNSCLSTPKTSDFGL